MVRRGQRLVIGAIRIVAPAHTLRDDLFFVIRDLAHAAPKLTGSASVLRRGIKHEPVFGTNRMLFLCRIRGEGSERSSTCQQLAGGGQEALYPVRVATIAILMV